MFIGHKGSMIFRNKQYFLYKSLKYKLKVILYSNKKIINLLDIFIFLQRYIDFFIISVSHKLEK